MAHGGFSSNIKLKVIIKLNDTKKRDFQKKNLFRHSGPCGKKFGQDFYFENIVYQTLF
jgi:hypothetical protein